MRRALELSIGLIALLGATAIALRTSSSRRFACTICGLEERRNTRLYIPTGSIPIATDCSRWFDTELGIAHAHDWMPVGCQVEQTPMGLSFGCSLRELGRDSVLGLLPRLPDAELARRAGRWLVQASAEQRRAEFATRLPIEEIGLALGVSAVPDAPPPHPSELRRSQRWLAESPLAREVFAPALR